MNEFFEEPKEMFVSNEPIGVNNRGVKSLVVGKFKDSYLTFNETTGLLGWKFALKFNKHMDRIYELREAIKLLNSEKRILNEELKMLE